LPARELIRPEPPVGNDAAEPFPPDAEWRGPSVYPTMDTLLDYFAAPPVLIADEPADLRKHAEDFQEEARAAYGGLEPSTPSMPPPAELLLPLSHLLEAGGARCLVTTEAIAPGDPARPFDHRRRRAVRQRRAAQSHVALQERRVPQIPRRGEGRRLRRARPAWDRPLLGAPSPRGPGFRQRLPDRRVCRRGHGLC